ncbi:MAG: hypothetical protein ABR508_09915 [Candidatus Baltobacteraceae bacterium]
MRRVPVLLLLFASLALVGVARPTPSPSPTPAAAPAPPRALPLVIVYPFDTSTDIKSGTGQSAAQVFMQQMNADGGLDTIEGPANVKRPDYLTHARSVNAAYYVAGYMTPLGNGVSLVEQVVSTRSGTIVFGQTAQIESIQDATAQATMLHDGITARERELSDAYTQTQAQATSTPAAGNQANIGKGLAGIAGLFHRNKSATPAPAIVKPAKGVFVVHVGGSLPSADLSRASDALYAAMNERYNVRKSAASPANLSKSADGICGTDRNNTIASGTASAQVRHHGFGARAQYTFVLDVYTCFGAKLAEETATADSLAPAVRKAVQAYATDYPGNG